MGGASRFHKLTGRSDTNEVADPTEFHAWLTLAWCFSIAIIGCAAWPRCDIIVARLRRLPPPCGEGWGGGSATSTVPAVRPPPGCRHPPLKGEGMIIARPRRPPPWQLLSRRRASSPPIWPPASLPLIWPPASLPLIWPPAFS